MKTFLTATLFSLFLGILFAGMVLGSIFVKTVIIIGLASLWAVIIGISIKKKLFSLLSPLLLAFTGQIIIYYSSIFNKHVFFDHIRTIVGKHEFYWLGTLFLISGGIYFVLSQKDINFFPADSLIEKFSKYNETYRIKNRIKQLLPQILMVLIISLNLAGAIFNKQFPIITTYIWITTIIIGLIYYIIYHTKKENYRILSLTKKECFFIIALSIYTAILLLPHLTILPFAVHDDEGQMGNLARVFYHMPMNIFELNEWNGFPNLGFLPMLLSLKWIEDSLFGLRVHSFILGILSLLPFYYLGREMFSRKVAALASIILVSSHIFIMFFRTGFHYNQGLVTYILSFSSLILGFKSNNKALIYVSGVFTALSFYVYFSARAIAIVIFLYFLYLLFKNWQQKRKIINTLIPFILGFLLFISPLAVNIIKEPGLANSRANKISILSDEGFEYASHELGTSNKIIVIGNNIIQAIEGLYKRDDRGEQYNIDRPFFEFFSAIFLVIGLIYGISKFKDDRFYLLTTSVLLPVLLGWGLTIGPPTFQKLPLILPPASLLIAYMLTIYDVKLIKNFHLTKVKPFYPSLFFLLLIIASNFEFYFYEYIVTEKAESFYNKHRLAAHAIEKYVPSCKVHIINFNEIPFSINFDNNAFRFLVPTWYPIEIINKGNAFHPKNIDMSRNKCFIIQPNAYYQGINRLNYYYPGGKTLILKDNKGKPVLVLYTKQGILSSLKESSTNE